VTKQSQILVPFMHAYEIDLYITVTTFPQIEKFADPAAEISFLRKPAYSS